MCFPDRFHVEIYIEPDEFYVGILRFLITLSYVFVAVLFACSVAMIYETKRRPRVC